ncbi:MAG: hypothetical protein CME61_06940 [Halobacteriovoraceae bacterium]|nr:hypothetical protein [Halobacteriovoraceae bacterium]
MNTSKKDFIMKVGNKTYIFFPTPEQRELLIEAVSKTQGSYSAELLEKQDIIKQVPKKVLF